MSRTVVGYEGEGKARRPVYADHGPANGAGGGTLIGAHAEVAAIAQAEASRLVEVGGRMPDGGAGKIERSMATEAQREAWRAADATAVPMRIPVQAKLENDGVHAKGTPEERAALSKARQADHRARAEADGPAMGSREHLQASRMRGAVRHLEVVGARRPDPEPRRSIAVTPDPVTPEEEPAMAIEPPPVDEPTEIPQLIVTRGDAIAALHVATTEALAAWEAWQEARHAEIRWEAACKALESAWRRTGLRGGPTSIDTALEAMKLGVELGRADGQSADDAPEIVTRPAPRRQADEPKVPGLTPRQQRAIDGLVAGKTRAEVARELSTTYQTVDGLIEAAARKGLVPAKLFPVLPARFAKYATTAG